MGNAITRSWLKTFERGTFCDLMGIPSADRRYLMDGHVHWWGVSLYFSQVSKDPSGCAEITRDWEMYFRKKEMFRRLGIPVSLAKYMTSIFVIMGEVQVRYTRKS